MERKESLLRGKTGRLYSFRIDRGFSMTVNRFRRTHKAHTHPESLGNAALLFLVFTTRQGSNSLIRIPEQPFLCYTRGKLLENRKSLLTAPKGSRVRERENSYSKEGKKVRKSVECCFPYYPKLSGRVGGPSLFY